MFRWVSERVLCADALPALLIRGVDESGKRRCVVMACSGGGYGDSVDGGAAGSGLVKPACVGMSLLATHTVIDGAIRDEAWLRERREKGDCLR